MSHIKQTTETTFVTDVLQAQNPVLVDFYADWCGPCKSQTPLLDKLAESHAENLDVVKINIDQAPELARQFGVRSIPTLILFENGEAKDSRIGLQNQTQLQEFVATS